MNSSNLIKARVEREKIAHNDKDVLSENLRLKNKFFPHLSNYLSKKRIYLNAFEYTNELHGKKILDLGCGKGERCLKYLENGGEVYGIDISPKYIKLAEQKAVAGGYSKNNFSFKVMDAHSLEFEDNTFDVVTGFAILHHLDFRLALKEVYRVLKPGKRALFIEPLGNNPIFRIARFLTPNARTIDERPFTKSDINEISNSGLWQLENSYCGIIEAPVAMLTSIILKLYPNNFLIRLADQLETWINKNKLMPHWNQLILFNLIKKSV